MSIVNCAKFGGFTMGLYENVREAAKEKGYSINRLEKELGFARSYIGKFKTITPSIDKIQKIADFLDVTTDYLMSGEEKEADRYYINDETAQVAQEIFENKELRALFDVQRGMSAEDLQALHGMALALKRKERGGNDDTGC